MFEKVILRRSEEGGAISAGQIAEALLFYQNVHLVIDLGSFGNLVRQMGAATLLSILQRQDCTAVYCEETLATNSQPIAGTQVHQFISMTLAGNDDVGKFANREERVVYMLKNSGTPPAEAKRFAKAFLRAAPTRTLSGNFYRKGGVLGAARSDVADARFVRDAAEAALKLAPGFEMPLDGLRFKVLDSDLGMYVFTNTDFEGMNRRRAGMLPSLEPVAQAHVLNSILEARADVALAAFYGGDFITSQHSSAVVRLRFSEILQRRELNEAQLTSFHNVVLPDFPSIRESIDSGQRSMKEFLLLLDRSVRFKEWLRSSSVDEGLVRSYTSAVSQEGWIQSLPAKGARYFLTTIAEAHNPILGGLAAIADSLVVERLLGGWRPNHFVANRLTPFLNVAS